MQIRKYAPDRQKELGSWNGTWQPDDIFIFFQWHGLDEVETSRARSLGWCQCLSTTGIEDSRAFRSDWSHGSLNSFGIQDWGAFWVFWGTSCSCSFHSLKAGFNLLITFQLFPEMGNVVQQVLADQGISITWSYEQYKRRRNWLLVLSNRLE